MNNIREVILYYQRHGQPVSFRGPLFLWMVRSSICEYMPFSATDHVRGGRVHLFIDQGTTWIS